MPLRTTSARNFRDARGGVRAGDDLGTVAGHASRAGGVVDHVPEGGGIPGGDADGLGAGVHGLFGEECQVAASGAERHDLKKVRGAVDDVNRLCADGTGGPEEDDFARLHGLSIPHRSGGPFPARVGR